MTTTALVLPTRGKAAKLVDERSLPSHLRCSSCQQPVFNSFQSPHGCRLCQTCVEGLPPQEKVPCPGKTDACRDKEEVTDISQASCFPDMASRRELGRLKVFCPNRQDGCGFQFPWRDVEAHLVTCEFEKVQCDMCGDLKLKREMEKHQRDECRQRRVQCGLCGVQVVSLQMDSEHRNLESSTCCALYSGPCPHCKTGDLTRAAFVRHLAECREKPNPCKFAHLGCSIVATSGRLEVHYREAADAHLELIDRRLRLTAATQVGGGSGLSSGSAASASAASAAAAPSTAAVAPRESTELERKALNIFAVFKRLQPHVATWAQSTIDLEDLMKAFGGPSSFKAVLKAMDDKLRQLDAAERASSAGMTTDLTGAGSSETARFLERMRLVEIRFDALELTTFDGCLTWKVSGYAAKRAEARSGSPGSLFSPPFFSRRYGYMFRVRLFLNGFDGAEGSHVSVQLVLMQSEYDDVLDWPLVADVTFRLVNPRSRTDDAVAKVQFDAQRPAGSDDLSVSVGVPKLAKIQTVEEKFVRNDCVYLETDVELRPTEAGRRGRRR